MCLETISWELFTEWIRSIRIVVLDVGGREHFKEREQIEVGMNISSTKIVQKGAI